MKSSKKEKDNKINIIKKGLQKKFGEHVFVSGQSILDRPRVLIPVSPALDLILGGGIQEGSLAIFTGAPKLGKTSAALHFAGIAQQDEYKYEGETRHVYFFNIEGRIEKRDIQGIKHLKSDEKHLTIIESNQDKILTGEEYIEIGESLIKAHPGAVFIFDSFSQLCTSGEMEAEIGNRYRADSPLLLARFCRRIANVIKVNNCIIIGITHLIANQGHGMSQWSEASGRKLQYQADVKLRGLYKKIVQSGETAIGQNVHWECDTSNIGAPGGKAESFLRYDYGLDKEYELVNLCSDIQLVNKSGAWYTLPNGSKYQGLDKCAHALKEDPKIYKSLNTKFREMMDLP